MRETEILVELQTPQGDFVCAHAGLKINKFSFGAGDLGIRRSSAPGLMGIAKNLKVRTPIYWNGDLTGHACVCSTITVLTPPCASNAMLRSGGSVPVRC